MKARCTSILNAHGHPATTSAWLTVGQVYDVLSVALDAHCRWWFRLMTDETDDVGLFRREQFEVVNSSLPETWAISWSADGTFELSPSEWLAAGFWERYFNGDLTARSIFDRETAKIIASGS